MGQDFPDWTDGIVQITGGQWLTDFPDWTKAEIVAPGGGAGGGGPNPVPGSVFWVDAQSIVGLTDGQHVTDWADRSGHARDATSVAAGRPPFYYSTTAAELINGHPVVMFDGAFSNQTTLQTGVFTVPAPMTIGMVIQDRGSTSADRPAIIDTTNGFPYFGLTNPPTPQMYDGFHKYTFGSTLASVGHSLIFVYQGATTVCYVDGVSQTYTGTGTPVSQSIVDGVQLGGTVNGDGLNCDMGEMIVWPFAMSALQVSQQYSYFHIRWGTP